VSRTLDRIAGWDRALTTRLALPAVAGAAHTRRRLAHIVAHSGDGALWLAGAALACVLGRGNWDEGGQRVFLATLFGGGTVWLLKQLFRRRRPSSDPQGLYLGLDVHSFPSGHAGRNACSVVLLGPLLPPLLQVSLLVWLGLLGLSRVALGIHYVSDVLAGFIVGGCIGWVLR
jgi:undecaprenyl-diphosphatase